MTKSQLEALLREKTKGFEATDPGDAWMFSAHDVAMQAFASEAKDRMRILALAASDVEPDTEQLRDMLFSCFNGDAHYAMHGKAVFAIYVHSLSGLRSTDLLQALREVASLVSTFGTTYASGRLRFEWPRPAPGREGVRRRTEESVAETNERMRGRSSGSW